MVRAALLTIAIAVCAAIAMGQGPTGSIRITVIDAVTHQPVKKANLSLTLVGQRNPGEPGLHRASPTDANGAFTFDDLPPGVYLVSAGHRSYPRGGSSWARNVTLAAGETADVTLQLRPGATVSGHVLDEDGDPIERCSVEAQPASIRTNSAVLGASRMGQFGQAGVQGDYRISNIPAGKYVLVATCTSEVFEPRPLSDGPAPPPSSAWRTVYYPGAPDAASAEPVEVAAGLERTGIDFKMTPRAVTHIHVAMNGAGPDANGNLSWRLAPAGESWEAQFGAWHDIPNSRRTFEIPDVFPGSYSLFVVLLSAGGPNVESIGAFERVTVGNEPVSVNVELRAPVAINGKIEMEEGTDPDRAARALNGANMFVESRFAQVGGHDVKIGDDGTFTFQSLFPVQLRVTAPGTYMKSMSAAGQEFPNDEIDPASIEGELRIVLSTKTGSVQGTAPAGLTVFMVTTGSNPNGFTAGYPTDENGQFKIPNLAPGDYLIGTGETFPFNEQDAQAITVHEGETVNLDLKPPFDSAAP